MRMFGQWTTIGISILAKPEGTDEDTHSDHSFRRVNFDTSCNEEAPAWVAALRDRYPYPLLIGTDTVSPSGGSAYFSGFARWAPVMRQLKPETKLKVFKTNHERILDEGRKPVRDWEKAYFAVTTPPQGERAACEIDVSGLLHMHSRLR